MENNDKITEMLKLSQKMVEIDNAIKHIERNDSIVLYSYSHYSNKHGGECYEPMIDADAKMKGMILEYLQSKKEKLVSQMKHDIHETEGKR